MILEVCYFLVHSHKALLDAHWILCPGPPWLAAMIAKPFLGIAREGAAGHMH